MKRPCSNLAKLEIEKLNDRIFIKIKNDLRNKYRCLIKQKNFDMNLFDKVIQKEIISFTIHHNPIYTYIFKKIEKLFLKEIANYNEQKYHGLLCPEQVSKVLTSSFFFDMGVSVPMEKVTLRKIIENERLLSPVDKFPKRQKTPRKETKFDIMKGYNQGVCNIIRYSSSIGKRPQSYRDLHPKGWQKY